jgi:hypothetical protein
MRCVGAVQLVINGGEIIGFYGRYFSCIYLAHAAFGQRLAKGYGGMQNHCNLLYPFVMVYTKQQ